MKSIRQIRSGTQMVGKFKPIVSSQATQSDDDWRVESFDQAPIFRPFIRKCEAIGAKHVCQKRAKGFESGFRTSVGIL